MIDDLIDSRDQQFVGVGFKELRRAAIRIALDNKALAGNNLSSIVVACRRSQLHKVHCVSASQFLGFRNACIPVKFEQIAGRAVRLHAREKFVLPCPFVKRVIEPLKNELGDSLPIIRTNSVAASQIEHRWPARRIAVVTWFAQNG